MSAVCPRGRRDRAVPFLQSAWAQALAPTELATEAPTTGMGSRFCAGPVRRPRCRSTKPRASQPTGWTATAPPRAFLTPVQDPDTVRAIPGEGWDHADNA